MKSFFAHSKKKVLIFFIFSIWITSCELLVGYHLDKAEKQRFKQWYANDFLPSSFKDTIHSIYDYSTFFKNKIVIKVYNRYSYGNLCVSKETIDFARRGDSIIKTEDKPIFLIKKHDGRTHSFKVDFCD